MVIWYAEFYKNGDGRGYFQCECEDFSNYFNHIPEKVTFLVTYEPNNDRAWIWGRNLGWRVMSKEIKDKIFAKKNSPKATQLN